MGFKLYDYIGTNQVNEIKKWTESLQKKDIAKLNVRLDMLAKNGPELFPNILTGTPTAGILKLRVRGNVQLRPMLCAGPISVVSEYTLLIGAKEVQSKIVPKGADKTADKRKAEIVCNAIRRIEHERVS